MTRETENQKKLYEKAKMEKWKWEKERETFVIFDYLHD